MINARRESGMRHILIALAITLSFVTHSARTYAGAGYRITGCVGEFAGALCGGYSGTIDLQLPDGNGPLVLLVSNSFFQSPPLPPGQYTLSFPSPCEPSTRSCRRPRSVTLVDGDIYIEIIAVGRCAGECGTTGSPLSVANILTCVDLALGGLPSQRHFCSECDANFDGIVTVDEILSAVSNLFNGCFAPAP